MAYLPVNSGRRLIYLFNSICNNLLAHSSDF
jgi:hypothetical protein